MGKRWFASGKSLLFGTEFMLFSRQVLEELTLDLANFWVVKCALADAAYAR